ncbi:D-alanyl-D-alanine carboxypeptidase family protein [Streptomyces beihaiensis]|uniref:Serine hydrolase n=1 Tax=Streptomyces beihaiensis TaxID=2984495 RepID=A0ABT3TS84_9ACTN|nr:serine hydrolase [Streptomyces beihaiensis]MCX3059891.1 serine hydrolase [Streptomyces beihaiensis]
MAHHLIRSRPRLRTGTLAPTAALCATLLAGAAGPVAAASPAPAPSSTPSVPAPPAVSALSWEVMDAGTGEVLAAHAPHRGLPPASTLKTLFALALLPKFSPNAVHRETAADLAQVAQGSSLVGLDEGHRYTVADLWRGVFLSSGNDAVHTLAQMNGGLPRTLAEMRATARRIGARDTRVRSPDGFDTPGQYSSAHDLALIAREGLKNADFRRYMGTKQALFPAAGGPGSYEIQNTNRLLVGSHGEAPYPGLIGVKNGYTSQAGNTLVTAARRGDHTILVTVLNPQNDTYNAVYEEGRALLDWGFTAAPLRDVRPVASARRTAKAVAGPAAAHAQARPQPVGARHIGAAAALLILSSVPLVIRGVRRRRAGRQAPHPFGRAGW